MTRAATWEMLVGRDDERTRLTSFLDWRSRTSPALALSGELGCGKTVLLEATLAAARAAGHRVLTASGALVEAGLGLATLNQVLQTERAAMAVVDDRDHAALAGAFGCGPAVADPARIASAALAALVGPGTRSPVLIAVDDVQWADSISIAVLAALARAAIGRPLGLLVAFRSDEPVQLDVSGFDVVDVPALESRAASTLLTRHEPQLAPSVHARVLHEAEGNPLTLLELATVFSPGQRRAQESLPPILALPRRLRAMVAARVLTLPDAVRRLLLVIALDGDGRVHRIAAARGQSTTELLASPELIQAVSSGVVVIDARDTNDGDTYDGGSNGDNTRLVITHPLLRLTLIATSDVDGRRRAHRALANAYADDAVRRALHLADGASGPDGFAAHRLADLGYAALDRGDAVSAVAALVRAADLSPERGDRDRRLAHAAYLCVDVVGDLERASALLAQARCGDTAGQRTWSGTTAAAYLRLLREGDVDTAHRLLMATLAALAAEDDPDRRTVTFALHALVEVCRYAGRPDWWTSLRAAMATFGDIVPVDLRLVVTVLGDPERAAPAATATVDTALAELYHQRSSEPTAIVRMATAALYVDRVEQCADVANQLADQGRTHGAVTAAVNAASVLSRHEFHRGRWARSAQLIDTALTLCRDHSLALPRIPLLYGQALLAAVGGDREPVERRAAEMTLWSAPRGVDTGRQLAEHARAVSALGRGDFAEAHRLLELVGPAVATPHTAPHTLGMIYDVAEAATRSGHRDEADAYVQAWHRHGIADMSSRLAVVATGAAALTAPASRAGSLFEQALAVPDGARWRFDHARVRLAYGEHLRRERKITRARTQLGLALADLRELGAWPWVSRASIELRAAGLDPAPAAGGDGILTPQQREIANLAGSGLTNKQIAERMQLSPRTVAAHLRAVFAKLGANTRGALHDALSDALHDAGYLVETSAVRPRP